MQTSDCAPVTRDRRVERGEATRAALVRAARELFAERGYAAVGTNELVERAGSTRGAMYHHFPEKKDLFRAAFEQLQEESRSAIKARMATAREPWDALVGGIRAFLDGCMNPSLARILLSEAPTVLGWQEWHALTARHSLGMIEDGLRAAIDAGVMRRADVPLLASVLFGAFAEAGLLLANAQDPAATRGQVETTLLLLLDGLRA